MIWPWTKKPIVKVKAREGAGGRWRWFGYDELDEMIVQGPPYGFDTKAKARNAAIVILDGKWEILFR